jgi:hypothetical protein
VSFRQGDDADAFAVKLSCDVLYWYGVVPRRYAVGRAVDVLYRSRVVPRRCAVDVLGDAERLM